MRHTEVHGAHLDAQMHAPGKRTVVKFRAGDDRNGGPGPRIGASRALLDR